MILIEKIITIHRHYKKFSQILLGRGTAYTGMVFFMVFNASANAQSLPDFTQIVADNAPAIVNVNISKTVTNTFNGNAGDRSQLEDLLRYFYGDDLPELPPELEGRERVPQLPQGIPERQSESLGSGFIISADGYIVTNHHVIDGAEKITITLNDRREFEAEVIGSDSLSDLAVLKIPAENLPHVELLKTDDVKVGEWVLAIGSPFGLPYSVAAGIVSYIGRSLPSGVGGQTNYVAFIQTDVAINPGHSGGPLFNLKGEVIGINSQIFTSSGGSIGLSFAIPVYVALNVVAQLLESGVVVRGYMGVSYEDVSQELAEAFELDTPHGALVNQVVDGSPAQEAGFESGDVIVAFNGEVISTSSDLPYFVGLTTPGTEANIEIIRNGRNQVLNMTVGSLPNTNAVFESLPEEAAPIENSIGIEVEELDDELKNQLALDNGVVIVSVTGEVAIEAGFREGDILISIAGVEIDSVSAFNDAVRELPANRALPVLVARSGRQSFFTIRIPD